MMIKDMRKRINNKMKDQFLLNKLKEAKKDNGMKKKRLD